MKVKKALAAGKGDDEDLDGDEYESITSYVPPDNLKPNHSAGPLSPS